jgi:hypothetical protein
LVDADVARARKRILAAKSIKDLLEILSTPLHVDDEVQVFTTAGQWVRGRISAISTDSPKQCVDGDARARVMRFHAAPSASDSVPRPSRGAAECDSVLFC